MAGFNLDNYVDTQTRITQFWENIHEKGQGFIHTELLTDGDNDTFVTIKASIGYYRTDGTPAVVATGIASETRAYVSERQTPGHNRVNEISWVENCETSAIGRACANYGMATSGADRPSREEMEKVARYEDAPPAERQAASGQAYTRPANPAQRTQSYGQRGGRPSGGTPTIQNPSAAPTERQVKMIMDMAKGNQENISYAMFEKPFDQINRQEASDIIGELMAARPAPAPQPDTVIIDDDGHTY